jgi:hypothetical protein
VLARAGLIGAVSSIVTGALIALLGGALRCIDSPEFYEPRTLVVAAAGAGMVATGAYLAGATRSRAALLVVAIGLVAVAAAIVSAPYKACAQFDPFPSPGTSSAPSSVI